MESDLSDFEFTNTPPDIKAQANIASLTLLPEISKDRSKNIGGYVLIAMVIGNLQATDGSVSPINKPLCIAKLFEKILFIVGRRHYKTKTPKTNVISQFIKCGSYALARKFEGKKKYKNLLDYSKGKYNHKIVTEMRVVFSILFLYTPLPVFWSLFDQQGSRWTFQASHMNGNFLGMVIVPDQFQVINAALVFLMIPSFNRFFYPWFLKYQIIENSLQRMAIGGVAAGMAFFAAGVLELVLEKTYPQFPEKQHAFLNIINTLPCDIQVGNCFNVEQIIHPGDIYTFKNISCKYFPTYVLNMTVSVQCGHIKFSRNTVLQNCNCIEFQTDTVLISLNSKQELLAHTIENEDLKKSLTGASRLRIAYIKELTLFHNVTITLKNIPGEENVYYVPDGESSMAVSAYMETTQGIYECSVAYEKNPKLYEKHIHLALGGVYLLIFREDQYGVAFSELYTTSVPNTISMFWQIPQYILISVAEIMFGIAGLEFSFTQAPRRLKTITIAGWYLSVAMGNFLVILITQLDMFESQAHEFFLFALLIVIDMVVFTEIASSYEVAQVAETTISSSFILTEVSNQVETPRKNISHVRK